MSVATFKHMWFYNVDPTSNYMHKVSNRSMNNTWCLLKVGYIKTPEQPFYCWLWTDFTLDLEDRNNLRGATYVSYSE